MWNKRYSEEGFAYGTIANDFLVAEYQKIPAGGKVLCLAEGEGRNAVFLAKQGFQVTAIDFSEVGLNKASQLALDNGVSISTSVVDLADYRFEENMWDGIISISAHVPEKLRQHIHKQIFSSLTTGGVFLLEAYTYKQTTMESIGGPPASQKEMFMSLDILQNELKALEQISGVETERIISEGKCHNGLSAVVQFIAKK